VKPRGQATRPALPGWRQALILGQGRLPLAVLLAGLLLTAVIAEETRRHGQQIHEQIEKTLLGDVSDAIAVKLQKATDTITGLAGLFNADNNVDWESFRRYYDTLQQEDDSLKGIQGIGFSRFIQADDWQRLIIGVRAEGFQTFRIRPPGPRSIGSSIVLLEPFDLRNQRAFGFDMYSESTRRQAMDRAAQSGLAALSGRVRLMQERSTDVQPGVLIYVPVYRRGTLMPPRSPQEYGSTLLGWAFAPIRVGDLVHSALGSVSSADLADSAVLVHDGDRPTQASLIFDNQQLLRQHHLTDPQYQQIEVAGRTWLIGIQLSRRLIGPNGYSSQFVLVLLLGTLLSTLAAQVTSTLVSNNLSTRAALNQAERANRERALANTVFETSPQAIVVTDPRGCVLSANQSFSRITGYSTPEILGRTLSLLKSGRHDSSFYDDLWKQVNDRGHWQGEIWNRLHDGEIRPHELSITAVRDQELRVTHYLGMLQDISDRHQAREVIRHRALHDELTGLPTRALLLERINSALEQAQQDCAHVGLLFLDLNGFKPVNDQHGHAIGDRLLQRVAQRLRDALRREDLVARLGGDEFVVLVPQAGGLEEMLTCARKVKAVIRGCGDDFEVAIAIDASIGIALSPQHGITTRQLLKAADQAMYRGKQGEGGGIAVSGTEAIQPTLDAPLGESWHRG
jgi:diguanylate cyclase (GGDEF)-like protein/PAS domain S-box-containing protein